MVHDELPKYLLAPEVSALLHYVPDLHRKMLLATLWNTGARINEALALTRGDFSLAPPYPFVQLATLKQRTEKAARTAERMPAGQQTHRLVPLSDSWYVSQLQTMVATVTAPRPVGRGFPLLRPQPSVRRIYAGLHGQKRRVPPPSVPVFLFAGC